MRCNPSPAQPKLLLSLSICGATAPSKQRELLPKGKGGNVVNTACGKNESKESNQRTCFIDRVGPLKIQSFRMTVGIRYLLGSDGGYLHNLRSGWQRIGCAGRSYRAWARLGTRLRLICALLAHPDYWRLTLGGVTGPARPEYTTCLDESECEARFHRAHLGIHSEDYPSSK